MTAYPIACVTLVVASLGGGCATGARTPAGVPPVVRIVATDYGYQAPDTVPAGFVTFRIVNRGNEGHAATIVRLDDGRTLAEYLEAYREANRTGGARPAWATFLGGPGALTPGDSAETTHHLEPGTYALGCFVPGPSGVLHVLEHNQAHAFVVVPGDQGAPAADPPEEMVTLEMLDYAFRLSAPLQPGRQAIRVKNAGADPHHALLFRLAAGKTIEDYRAWMNTQQGQPPATLVGMMAELSTGRDAVVEVDLPAGDYVLVCLVAGRDEVPHVAKGMIQHIRVE